MSVFKFDFLGWLSFICIYDMRRVIKCNKIWFSELYFTNSNFFRHFSHELTTLQINVCNNTTIGNFAWIWWISGNILKILKKFGFDIWSIFAIKEITEILETNLNRKLEKSRNYVKVIWTTFVYISKTINQ